MKKSLVLCCIFISILLNAQESISNLISNPCLSSKTFKSIKGESSLILPFIDDFSYLSNVVDANLWHNSSVFVNRSYPINPPTLGVATFDGMDEEGLARDFTPNSPLILYISTIFSITKTNNNTPNIKICTNSI